MEDQIIEAAAEVAEANGMRGAVIGLAAVGAAAICYGTYKFLRGARESVKESRGFSEDLSEEMKGFSEDPKFRKVREHFAKKAVDADIEIEKKEGDKQ